MWGNFPDVPVDLEDFYDDSGGKLRKWLRSQKNPDLSLAAEIDMIESGAKKIPRHPGGW
jgi:hypothetical protein